MDEELELFAPEPAPPLPPLKERVFGAVDVKWTRYRQPARERVHCADCTKRIHESGAAAAPPPRLASWRRKGPMGDLLLCSEDAETHKSRDAEAERERARRLAIDHHRGVR